MSLEVGQILGGKYFIERVIGRGSMGLVYEGRDTASGQRVAIRLIMPEFDNEQVPAFTENDATVVGQSGDEHSARLFNIGFLPSGERCIVSEFVEGEVLQHRMKRVGPMSELTVAQLLIQLLESLSAAHEVGIVHRDLTPLSIIMVPRSSGGGEAVKLIDFGISRLQLLTANPNSPPASIVAETESFQYLSPEQLNGIRELDPRSNIYTLGVIAYQAITGKLPFEGKDFGDLTFNILREDPVPVEELAPESSSPFVQLITKAMARSPNARFQYAEEMYAAISNWASRAGIARAALESGVTQWLNQVPEEPITSERASTPESAFSAEGSPQDEPEPTTLDAMPAISEAVAGVPDEPVFERTDPGMAPVVETETLPFPATGVLIGIGDPFHPQMPVGLAEEDALFAPPPTAPRDELPFVALETLASSPAAAAPPERVPETQAYQPPLAVAPASSSPRYGAQPSPNHGFGPSSTESAPQVSAVANFGVPTVAIESPSSSHASAQYGPTPTPPQEAVPVAQVSPEPSPSQLTNPEVSAVAAPAQAEGKFRRSGTILGIGSIGVRGPEAAEPGAGGVVVRAPQSAEVGVNSIQASPGLAPFRPRQATEPGINPIPSSSPSAASSPAAFAQPSVQEPLASPSPAGPVAAAQPAATKQVQISKPATSVTSASVAQAAAVQPAAAKEPTPAPVMVAADAPTQPRPVTATAATDLEDMGPYGVAPSRSRKRLVVTIVLLGLAVAGVAVALLQNKPEIKKTAASEPTYSAVPLVPSIAAASAEPAVVAPSATPQPVDTAAKTAETVPESSAKEVAAPNKKPAPSLAQSIASAVPSAHVTAAAQPKPQHTQRPVQGTPPATVSVPTKQGSAKAATGYDPYKYR